MAERQGTDLWGLVAEFDDLDRLVAAIRRLRASGYRRLDAYAPFPAEEVPEALGFRENRLPYIALAGGILGGVGGFFLQWYLNAYNYPINVGGRPLAAWPAFALPAFELTVLGAALAVVVGMLWLNGLPRLYHPVFNADHFSRATVDRFFLAVEVADPRYHPERTRGFLLRLGANAIEEVPE